MRGNGCSCHDLPVRQVTCETDCDAVWVVSEGLCDDTVMEAILFTGMSVAAVGCGSSEATGWRLNGVDKKIRHAIPFSSIASVNERSDADQLTMEMMANEAKQMTT